MRLFGYAEMMPIDISRASIKQTAVPALRTGLF
jgi:hypothetical protein